MIERRSQLVRFIVNGIVATAAHYLVLKTNIDYFGISSKGVANALASVVGISVSFLGNKYFVFLSNDKRFLGEALRFLGVYIVTAFIHGIGMWLWADRFMLDYSVGFFLLTGVQVAVSYVGNKYIVFRDSA